jgi:hypothetical protein
VWPAFVLADVPGRAPSGASCLEGVAGLQRLVTDGTVALVAPEGFAHSDFRCPECGGNALTDEAGRFQYVDAQNFVLSDYRSELLRVGRAVAADSHFGDRSWLRGGAYLYQSIPGIPLAAKRRIDVRSGRWLALLERYGESLDGRVVLDVGCNLGGLMGVYLGAGAAWCHGWDRPNVVERTREVLLAVGAGRFSLTGGELSTSRALEADLPPHVRANLNGCAVSYLSVRRHLGWLESLTALPWRLMLYEGHEGEGRTETEGFLTALRKRVAFESLELVEDRDGDSLPRFRALLRRTDLPGPGRPA